MMDEKIEERSNDLERMHSYLFTVSSPSALEIKVITFGSEQGKMTVKYTHIFKYFLPSMVENMIWVLRYFF